jgi:hypothetical protein
MSNVTVKWYTFQIYGLYCVYEKLKEIGVDIAHYFLMYNWQTGYSGYDIDRTSVDYSWSLNLQYPVKNTIHSTVKPVFEKTDVSPLGP